MKLVKTVSTIMFEMVSKRAFAAVLPTLNKDVPNKKTTSWSFRLVFGGLGILVENGRIDEEENILT